MIEKKIIFIHTTGDWWESRYHYKQIPALKNAGYNVIHLVRYQDTSTCDDCSLVKVSSKGIRATGGLILIFKILKLKGNIIQICNIEALPLGIILSVFFRKKVFYDCIEDHYSSMLYSKTDYPKRIRMLFAKLVLLFERIAEKTFMGFITSDPYIYESHQIISKGKKMLFYNMPALRNFGSIQTSDQKCFDLVILGSMSIRTGVLDVLRAMVELRKENIMVTLKLIGDPYKDKKLEVEMKKLLKENNFNKQISISGKIPFYKVPLELSNCRIGLIPLLDLPKFQNNIAMKQWEYWALGLPVLASKLTPQKYFIKDGYNGIFYEPGNIEDLKLKILHLLRNPEKIKTLGRNGQKKFYDEWNSENQERKYVDFYNLCIEKHNYFETELPPIKL